jgi:stalled ribosome rescue protein Dom34
MAKVRIEIKETEMWLLLECLRYAGVISKVETESVEKGNRHMTVFKFDLYPPQGVQDQVWADMNAKRMRSFMVKAVVR